VENVFLVSRLDANPHYRFVNDTSVLELITFHYKAIVCLFQVIHPVTVIITASVLFFDWNQGNENKTYFLLKK